MSVAPSAVDLSAFLGAGPHLTSVQRQELPGIAARCKTAGELCEELGRRGWLTPFQVERLQKGLGEELRVGDFALLDKLGEGGMGEVYKARQAKPERICVIKLIRPELTDSDKVSRRFEREMRAAARLNHPNIVATYEVGEASDRMYIAMEYVEGIDLAHHVLKDGPLSPERACDFTRQAALALQHAHEAGLIHRDIKPDNFLLATQTGKIKLLDLGLCRRQPKEGEQVSMALTVRGTAVGTPEYMAPEQIRDSSGVDICADIYGLGCTLYFLLTGRDPYAGGNAMEVLYRKATSDPEPVEKLRPGLPMAVVRVVRKMMARDANQRFQTPKEVATILEQILDPKTNSEGLLANDPAANPLPPTPRSTTRAGTRTFTRPVTSTGKKLPDPGARDRLWVVAGLIAFVGGGWGAWYWIRNRRATAAPPSKAAGRPTG